jgi:hypothetical protein
VRLTITKDTSVEDLVKACPDAVGFLINMGLPCVVCGEPFWGSLEELARRKNWSDSRISELVAELDRRRV